MNNQSNIPRILTIAGSDSGGGAGIQADIKTITALGGFATTAITALTAQNTLAVHKIYEISADFVKQQIKAVLSDIGADAIKIGMVNNEEIITIIADILTYYPKIPIIIDPVMKAKDGVNLLQDSAIKIMQDKLFPLATLITPNIPEAEILAKMQISNLDDMRVAAKKIGNNILIKGGHLNSPILYNLLYYKDNFHIFESEYIDTKNTHGTGCSLASAIAVLYSRNKKMPDAVENAGKYIAKAIKYSPNIGSGNSAIWHSFKFNY